MHWPLLSAKNKLGLQFTQAHQNRTIKDWKHCLVLWVSSSSATVESEFGVNRKPWIHQWYRLLLLVEWCRWFFWHTLAPLETSEHCLNATAYLTIVADYVHRFTVTRYPNSVEYFQQDNATCHKGQIISIWSSLHSNDLYSHQISLQQYTFGRWLNSGVTSQMCSNCGMLLYEYGPKSLRAEWGPTCYKLNSHEAWNWR